ncbi:ATP-binding protein, partial [Porphyromonas endodontalis]
VDFIATQLLRKARTCSFREKPILLFIDEAHQFLNKRISADDDTSFYLQGIELIAKEARKYGLFLCLATQMPRDIPLGILSQMGAFIVHRLINEQDKKAVESAASSLNKSMLSFLPTMGAGEALLMGVDFPMPLLLKIEPPIRRPLSGTPKLSKKQTIN